MFTFVCLDAGIDRYSTRALAWRSSTPTREAQFTGVMFTGLLTDHGIRISMDGKDCWCDNVFIERLSRSLKSEEEAVARARGLSRRRPRRRLRRMRNDGALAIARVVLTSAQTAQYFS